MSAVFNPERLLEWEIPEIRQAWGPRDNALFALSIGMSRDPLVAEELPFTAGVGGWKTLPGMAFILGHPGFWAADPATGIDVVKLVHGEENAEILAPLPPEGEIIAKSRVIGLADKGADKGAVMYVEKEIRDAASGEIYARVYRTSFLRGNGGFGGSFGRAAPSLSAPEGTPDQVITLQTDPSQALLYRWNGDHNPLHFDPAIGARAGFRQPILHGVCTLSIAAQIGLGALAGWDTTKIRGISGRFTAVVYPGETLAVELWNSGAFRVRVIERDVVAINHGMLRLA